MKFVRYEAHGETAYGMLDGDAVHQIADSPFGAFRITNHTHRLSEVRLLAPCTPGKVLAMALNYRSHLGQVPAVSRPPPTKPEVFFKLPSCIISPEEPIHLPRDVKKTDAEGELVVVIGKRCRRATPQEAPGYVLGYTCGNDVSARDWQQGDVQWWRAKGSDTFGPLGPAIVTDLNPGSLDLRVRVNGQEVVHGNTGELIFDVPTIISFISQTITLEPGDVIFTGTPGTPPQLKDGDMVEVEIAGIGVLRNPVQLGE